MPALNNYSGECCGADSCVYGMQSRDVREDERGRGRRGCSGGYSGRSDDCAGRAGERGYERDGAYGGESRGSDRAYGRGRDGYRGRNGRDDDFRFEIVERYGIVATSPSGWSKELNRVSWNGKEPKLDFREWNPGHSRMRRGVTFTDEEALELRELIDIALRGREGEIFREFDSSEDKRDISDAGGPLIDEDTEAVSDTSVGSGLLDED